MWTVIIPAAWNEALGWALSASMSPLMDHQNCKLNLDQDHFGETFYHQLDPN